MNSVKKIKVLALVLVFTFAALGGAYAMWYDTLFVNETVNTGLVNVEWYCAESSDPGANYSGFNNDVTKGSLDRRDTNNPNEAKNIGQLEVTKADDNEQLPAIALSVDPRHTNDTLNITLTNGYPGYQEYVGAQLKNTGTVPVKFQLTAKNIPYWLHVQLISCVGNTVYFDSKGGVATEIGQVDPEECKGFRIITRVLQSAPQKAEAQFSLELKGIQWNEYNFALPNAITPPLDEPAPAATAPVV